MGGGSAMLAACPIGPGETAMLDPSRVQGMKPWQVFAWCYVAFLLIHAVQTILARGAGDLGIGNLVAPVLSAGLLTLIWWFVWGRKAR